MQEIQCTRTTNTSLLPLERRDLSFDNASGGAQTVGHVHYREGEVPPVERLATHFGLRQGHR